MASTSKKIKHQSSYTCTRNTVKKSFVLFFIAFLIKRTLNAGDPIYYIIPNTLLYTPFVQLVTFIWKTIDPWKNLSEDQIHRHVAILDSKDFSFSTLRDVTQNFRYPVVVRGLFKDTSAVKHWGKDGYLSKKFGNIQLPFIDKYKYGEYQDFRSSDYFDDVFNEIMFNPNSTKSLFFPVLSRFQLKGKDSGITIEELINITNKVIHDDLHLSETIWNGFATSADRHKGFYNSQFIIGRGNKHMNSTTGTGWHAEPGHNYFTQVIGKKRWYLMEPKYSSLMLPLRGGMVNMQSGCSHVANTVIIHNESLKKRLPLLYVDTYPGDLLYVPDWYWHTVKNYEGFNIGCPIRELNISLAVRNNAHYMSIIALNKFMKIIFGIDIGGFPPQR